MENQFVFKVLEIFHQERSSKTAKQESEYFDIPLDDDDEMVKEKIVEVPLDDGNDLVLQKRNEHQGEFKHENYTNLEVSSLKSDPLQQIDSEETPIDLKEIKKQYSCKICFNEYSSSKSLSHHRAFHKGKTTCLECGKVYSTKNCLRLHVRNIHLKEFRLKCEECGYKTNMSDALTKHRRTHTGEKPFGCESCEYRSGDPNSIINHKRTHHDPVKRVLENKHFCELCGKSFGRMNAYKKHQDMHAGVKRVKKTTGKSCEICGKILYGNAGSLAQHLTSHANNLKSNPNKSETLPNEIANKSYATTAHKCSVCQDVFTSLKFLSKHKNEQHTNLKKDDEQITQFCEICRKEFSSRQSFRHHTIVTHTKVYPVMCDGCGKGFTGTGLGETLEKHKQMCVGK